MHESLKRDALKIMTDPIVWVFFVIALVLVVWIWYQEGASQLQELFLVDVYDIALRFGSVSVFFFVIVGSINYLARKHPQAVSDILSGAWGDFPMILIAAFLPASASGTQLRNAWDAGSYSKNVLMCLVTLMTTSFGIILSRAPILGWKLTLIWTGIGSTIVGCAWLVSKILR